MALNSTRSAWSIATQSLRPLLQPCTSSSAAASSSFAISSVSATAAVSCRRAQYHDLARTPTALREQDDPLNKPASETDLEEARPRWAYTPEAMKGRHGFSLNYIRKPHRAIWHVNEDPVLLDNFYERFLGRNGAKMLPDELKWLAVTHKSFDYGSRGFNTRLAFFGRQILVVEAMNAIMTRPMTVEPYLGDPWKRDHFVSPALQSIDKLSVDRPQDLMSVDALARVGLKTQLDQVMRWKPRIPENLKSSGINVVLSTTIFAIVGAVSLQHGGEVASKIAREKVLGRLSHAST